QAPRLVLEQDRHAAADRECEAVGLAHELGRGFVVAQRRLTERTGEDVEQLRVHVNFRKMRSTTVAGSSAVSGTNHRSVPSNAVHFTASFSVISTGSPSPKSRSRELN